MYETADIVEHHYVIHHAKKIRDEIRNEKNTKRREEAERLENEEKQRKVDEKNARLFIPGMKRTVHRSVKPETKKKEEKKQDLTQEEIDLNKYLGPL